MLLDLDNTAYDNGYYKIKGRTGVYILQLQPCTDTEGSNHSWIAYFRKNSDIQEEEIFRTYDILDAFTRILTTENDQHGPYNVQVFMWRGTNKKEYLDKRALTREQLINAVMILDNRYDLREIFSKPYRERIAKDYKLFIGEVLKSVRKDCQVKKVNFILDCREENKP